MCGIAGFIDTSKSSNDEFLKSTVENICRCLISRGPDDYGSWTLPKEGIALGHRRLSIIDLSPNGAQPMSSASGNTIIVLNGEIYNFNELRETFCGSGIKFRGSSDTEVLLELIERDGIESALNQSVGMFAFAVYDKKTRTITLAKDRLGEKPLYYGWAKNTFVFGSTPRAIIQHPDFCDRLDRNALSLYFQTNYIPTPFCIHEGVKKLPAGTFLPFQCNDVKPGTNLAPRAYWKLLDVAEKGQAHPSAETDSETIDQVEFLLKRSVLSQMVSDVPLGAFLSGGIDSSLVVALMQSQSDRPIKTFTIGFDEIAYDESQFADPVAKHLGTDHTTLIVSEKDAIEAIPKMPEYYDEPFADSSMVPTSLVASLARKHVTVALSGDGGDEVFCGYNRQVRLIEMHRRLSGYPARLRKIAGKLIKKVPTRTYDSWLRRKKSGLLGDQVIKMASLMQLETLEERYLALTEFWEDPEKLVLNSKLPSTLLTDSGTWPNDLPPLMQLLWIEAMTSLPDDMLVKVDRAGMGVSLESRMPLLDHRVIDYAWSLDDKFRIRNGESKWVLRQVLYRYVPRNLIDRPKSGFGMPIDVWLRGPLRDWAESLLDPSVIKGQGILNPDLVTKAWNEHLTGQEKWQGKLWGVLMFQAWLNFDKSC